MELPAGALAAGSPLPGTIVRQAAGEAGMGQAFIRNFGAAIVGVSERAMIPAIDQLLKPEEAAPAVR
jgi:hypothetical protein